MRTMQRVGNGLTALALGLAVVLLGWTMPASATTTTWTGTGDWFGSPANWSAGVPAAGDDVVIASGAVLLTNATPALASLTMNGGTLTFTNWDTALNATSVTINAGAVMTHAVNSAADPDALGEWVPDARVFINCSNLTVEAGGRIDADGRGYAALKGPGAVGGGPSHAGDGAYGTGGSTPKPAYGDPAAPVQPGSGGSARAGGGSIRVDATGLLRVKGTVTANGQPLTPAAHETGSSGGSIWLSCSTFAGTATGLISVDGGRGYYYGLSGSGGRIALLYDTDAQASLSEPCPPVRFSGFGAPADTLEFQERRGAAMGTLHLPDTRLLTGPFTGKRFHHTRLVIPGFTNWTPASLTLNDCILGLPAGLDLNVTGDLVVTNGGALHLFAAPTNAPSPNYGALVTVGGSLFVHANSWILPYADPTNGASVLFTVDGNLTVASGGGFNADDRGSDKGKGPGIAGGGTRTGAGYGGEGGPGVRQPVKGQTYGTAAGPVQPGSGGGGSHGGRGGGAIRLQVAGDAIIDGLLSARGGYGSAQHATAGSGGGIEIVCRTLRGANTGLLRAEGGQGNYYGASGGGGRIVIRYDQGLQGAVSPLPSLRFSTYAYPRNTVYDNRFQQFWGGSGTLYLPDTALLASSPTGAAVLDRYRFWHTTLTIGNLPSVWSPSSLIVSNSVVAFPSGYCLDVPGNVILGGGGTRPSDLLGASEGRLTLVSRATNTLYGTRLDVGGDLTILTNGWLWPMTCGTNGPAGSGQTNAIVGIRVAGNVAVKAGGGLLADGGGYKLRYGGPGGGKHWSHSGASYGGKGGGVNAGDVYGTEGVPLQPGSSGGSLDVWSFGIGGGAIHVVAGGDITVDGTLQANGTPGDLYGGAGGSGGSILLACKKLYGAGILRANGGAREANNGLGDGGGGRIAVWTRTAPEQADLRMARKSLASMTYTASIPTFSGQLFVDKGGANAQDGTKGFWEGSPSATVIFLR